MANQKNLEEIQFLEQNLQNLIFQKQAFQMELSETEASLKEINSSNEDVFRVVGQLMIKKDKKNVIEELQNKKKVLDLRISSLDKQESSFSEKLEKLRGELIE